MFALICPTLLASRPDIDEADRRVHIATSGHFVKHSAAGSHHHHRGRHPSTSDEGELRERQGLQKQMAARAREQEAAALMQVREHGHDHREHLLERPSQEEKELSLEHQLLKLQWQRAKQEFDKDAATRYEGDESNHAYGWSGCIPYWTCRILFVAAAIYAFTRYPFFEKIPQMKKKAILAAIKWRREFRLLSEKPKNAAAADVGVAERPDLCEVPSEEAKEAAADAPAAAQSDNLLSDLPVEVTAVFEKAPPAQEPEGMTQESPPDPCDLTAEVINAPES